MSQRQQPWSLILPHHLSFILFCIPSRVSSEKGKNVRISFACEKCEKKLMRNFMRKNTEFKKKRNFCETSSKKTNIWDLRTTSRQTIHRFACILLILSEPFVKFGFFSRKVCEKRTKIYPKSFVRWKGTPNACAL